MEVPLSRMGSIMKLTTQNPLSLLVKFGIMAWNGTCADNCSGHGECHNGTCLCEVGLKDLQWKHIKISPILLCLPVVCFLIETRFVGIIVYV